MQSYNRRIIDLKVSERGFATQSKGPSGYCKLETRGKKSRIKVNISNLQKTSKAYLAQLIKTDEDSTQLINLGIIKIDDQNNGMLNISVDSDNVLGTGLGIDDFAIIAVASLDNRRHPIFPLVGYIKDANPSWKQYVHTGNEETYGNAVLEPVKKEEPIPRPKILGDRSSGDNREPDKASKTTSQSEHQESHHQEAMASTGKKESVTYNKPYESSQGEKEDPVYYSDHTYNTKKSIEINDMGNQTFDIIKKHFDPNELEQIHKNIFKDYPRMSPFERVDADKEWVRIEPADIIYFPMDTWMLTNNTFLLNGYRRYKHLILGRNKVTCHDKPHFYLGVPGIYYPKDRVAAYFYGFKDFMCCANTGTKAGEYGYWIVEIEG